MIVSYEYEVKAFAACMNKKATIQGDCVYFNNNLYSNCGWKGAYIEMKMFQKVYGVC